MPYSKIEDANPSLRGIKPPISLEQANLIASWADGMEKGDAAVESPWGVAIAQFKKVYEVQGDKWVKKAESEETEETEIEDEEEEVEEFSPSWKVDIGGQSVPMQELVNVWKKNCIKDDNPPIPVFVGERMTICENDADVLEYTRLVAPESVFLEEGVSGGNNKRTYARLRVRLVKPGWGNTRDNNYYTREVLSRDAHVWVGSKMYEVDHRNDQKNNRNWVSTVERLADPLPDGSPTAIVGIHDPNFAERVHNLDKLGLLHKLENSITGDGKAKPFELGGRKGKVVEAITKGGDVDWVTSAGAGGHALALIENDGGSVMETTIEKEPVIAGEGIEKVVPPVDPSASITSISESESSEEGTVVVPDVAAIDKDMLKSVIAEVLAEMGIKQESGEESVVKEEGEPPTEVKPLDANRVKELVNESKLPEPAQNKLLEGSYYSDEDSLLTLISQERAYLQELTNAGSPIAMGEKDQPVVVPDEKSYDEKLAEANELKSGINKKYGVSR